MAFLTESDIDWIAQQVANQGMTDRSMSESILDHLCCLVENKDIPADEWKRMVTEEIKKMHPVSLKELEFEKEIIIQQLKNKPMKKIVVNALAVSALLLVFGVIFKIFHLPGAAINIILGTIIGVMAVITYILQSTSKRTLNLETLLTIFACSFSLGCLFKIQHWPFATLLMLSGALGSAFIYAPLKIIAQRKISAFSSDQILPTYLLFLLGTMIFMLFDLRLL